MSETKLYIATRESGHETIRATSFEDFLSKLARWTAGSGGAYIYDSWALITDQGTKSVPELRMVSIATGRTIEYVNGKYVARGVPAESREDKPMFRIGGVYRQRDGDVVMLRAPRAMDQVGEGFGWATPPNYDGFGFGYRMLIDGSDEGGWWAGENRCLLPGELHQVDDQWVPLEDKPAKSIGVLNSAPIGATALIPVIAGERALKKAAAAKSIGAILREKPVAQASKTPTLDKLANAAEPKRPALTWNQPTRTDRFAGFSSTYDGPVIAEHGEGLGVLRSANLEPRGFKG